ncbi:MAG TPA: GNAT family N-acetyltransferase [Acidimicrobiales bacterium]|nr:GNAT family N-acetyltransferase [Acidimicrobiales bacterium]
MPVDEFTLRDEEGGSGAPCRAILAELPEWFGIPEAVDHYVEVAGRSLTVVASHGGRDVGFLSLVDHGPFASEIYVMGVRPAYHRRGIGRRLVGRAEDLAFDRGAEFLQVKTLSERRDDPSYAATRAFYVSCGFRPLEEFPTLWDEANPALQLVKHVGTHTGVHHVELWVPDLARALGSFGWLLDALGYRVFQEWAAGRSWRRDGHYVVLEQSPALTAPHHDRLRPGLNHLAFHAGEPAWIDRLVADAGGHGWRLLFEDRHPHAGGPDHYAAYLENDDGFEVELVATRAPRRGE